MNGRAHHSLVTALAKVPGFDVLGERSLLRLIGCSFNLVWPAGSYVFRKGAPGDALFVVVSGRVEVLESADGDEVKVAEIGAGDFFGEASLLADATRTKDVRVLEKAELLVLLKDTFRELLDEEPQVAGAVRSRLEARTGSSAGKVETETLHR